MHGRPSDPAPLDRLTELAAHVLRAPMAQVALLGSTHTVVSGYGLPPGSLGSVTAVRDTISHLNATLNATLAIPDLRADERTAALLPVRTRIAVSYLGVPLRSGGDVIGVLCVGDNVPRRWSNADVRLIEQLGISVRRELELASLVTEHDADRVRWELAVEVSELGYLDWDLVTGVVVWDERLMALHGDGDHFTATIDALYSRIHPDDRNPARAQVSAAIEAVGPIQLVYRVVHPDGSVRSLEVRARALAGRDGTAVRMLGVTWDVTERELQEYRADRVLSSMPLGFLSMDTEWRVTHVNAEGARLSGYTYEELIGRSVWELFPDLAVLPFEEVYRRVARTHVAETVEAYYPEPLNTWFDVRVTGDHTGVSIYFLDATDRRRAQAVLAHQAERDRSVATALQLALLPELPAVPELEIAARYVAADDDDQVGGDWYDVVMQPDGALLAVIGDVVGHDIHAAATMGRLRTTLRAIAWNNKDPLPGIVAHVDEATQGMELDTLASLVAMRIGARDARDGGHRVQWTNAGHPPPIRLNSDGTSDVLDYGPTDVMVGAGSTMRRHEFDTELPGGATLVLYTDGVVESRTVGLDDGIQRLRETLLRHRDLPLEDLVDAVIRESPDLHASDDIAILAIRPRETPTRS